MDAGAVMRPREPVGLRVGRIALLTVMLVAACTPQHAHYTVRRAGVDCTEASRLAYETFVGLGYEVRSFEVARSGQPGLVEGIKGDGEAAVEIACDPEGITATPEPGEILPDIEFVRGFHFAYTYRLDHPPETQPLPLAGRPDARSAAAGRSGGGVRVTMHPRPGLEAKSYIGVDPNPSGLLPVEVTVVNGSERAVRLRSDAVVLIARDGRRVRPVAAGSVRTKLGDAADNMLNDQALEGGASTTGFLFYPADDYRGARAILEDVATGETEGFLTEF